MASALRSSTEVARECERRGRKRGWLTFYSPGGAIYVAAPGVNIRVTTTAPNGDSLYQYGTGTSIASPHVAGLVALYIAANGRATNAAGVFAIRQAIINASLPQSQ